MAFPVLVAAVFLLGPKAMSQQCEESPGFRCSRTFIGMDRGPLFPIGGKEVITRSLGSCRTPEEHAAKMIDYYESNFDLDLSRMRADPFVPYDYMGIQVTPYSVHPETDYRIVTSTLNGSASYMNVPITFASWNLTADRDLSGKWGVLPSGKATLYGLYR